MIYLLVRYKKILYKKIWRLSLPPMNLVRCTTKSSPHSAVPKPLSPSFLVPLVSLPLSRGSPAPSPRRHGTEALGRRRRCGLRVNYLSHPTRSRTWSPSPVFSHSLPRRLRATLTLSLLPLRSPRRRTTVVRPRRHGRGIAIAQAPLPGRCLRIRRRGCRR